MNNRAFRRMPLMATGVLAATGLLLAGCATGSTAGDMPGAAPIADTNAGNKPKKAKHSKQSYPGKGGGSHHPPQQQGGKGGGKANFKGPHPRSDHKGRYLSTRDCTEVCFKFAAGGHEKCKAPCAVGRAHVCQICLQPHPNAECSKRG